MIAGMIRLEDLYARYRSNPLISTDTRNLPEGCIFFALKGANFNGNRFAAQALEMGAAWAVVDDPSLPTQDRFLQVADSLAALQQLALHHRKQLALPVLAVTGSNGKTTTKELLHAVLSRKLRCYATTGNLNNHIGVPLCLLSVSPEHEFAVIEMGANHQGEIAFLCSLALPTHGLITNVGKAHLEGFGGFEGVKKGKGELYAFLAEHDGTVFLNGDNAHLSAMADEAGLNKCIRYGTVAGFDCRGELSGADPFLSVSWSCGNQGGTISTHLTGAYNLENVLAAACVGNYFGVEAGQVSDAIAAYVPANSRSQLVEKGSNRIVLDAYNANPTSMAAALKNFASLEARRKIVILGGMAELGADSDREHQALADLLDEMAFDEVILVGPQFRNVRLRHPFRLEDTADAAAARVRESGYQGATILIKGSRTSRMEKVFEAL